jgi:hypothetical protein
MGRVHYQTGQNINGLIFVEEVAPHLRRYPGKIKRDRRARFQCVCGTIFTTLIRSVLTSNTRTCGCFTGVTARKDRTATHHLRSHPLYRVWQSMKMRCLNPNRPDYPWYGGSGITISGEFRTSFQAFYDHVVSLPDYERRATAQLTLDRIQNDQPYTRGNLRWVSRKIQANNRRNTYGKGARRV